MRYLLLVHVDEQLMKQMTPAEDRANTEACIAYDQELDRRGLYIASNALQGPETATVVRVRNGKVSMTDGPYVETKEHLGGFILIEARDLNEAVKVAQDCPMANFGSIEVRPELDLEV